MNIEKIFIAVEKDEMNSALGNICAELENQNYKVKIFDIEINSEEIFNGKAEYLEQFAEPYIFEIENADSEKQRFGIRFLDYHNFVFQKV